MLAQAPPSADTFSYSGSPNFNYGAYPILAVQQGANTYLKFNLSTLPSGPSVTKATLRLYVDAVGGNGSFDVFQLNSSWSEGTLTYNNAPALGSSATGNHPIPISGSSLNQFVVVNITTLVNNWVNGSIANNGVALGLIGSAGSFSFDSKESLFTSHQPELEIVLNGPAGPQGPPGWITGYIASIYALRPQPFYLGIGVAFAGLLLSLFFAKETRHYATLETRLHHAPAANDSADDPPRPRSMREVFALTSWKDRNLFSCSQAGLVNNLNDGMSWGIYPLFFASLGLGVAAIGTIKAVYPAAWGILQLVTGPLSDRWGRKWLIACGMVVQAGGIWLTVQVPVYTAWIIAALLQGVGTAMVYPTLLAAISDVAHPEWRATAMGAYRFWRDLGYALGALISGVIADLLGMRAAIKVVAALTLLSGLQVAFRMRETHGATKRGAESIPSPAAHP